MKVGQQAGLPRGHDMSMDPVLTSDELESLGRLNSWRYLLKALL
jgi:hypothetical protein